MPTQTAPVRRGSKNPDLLLPRAAAEETDGTLLVTGRPLRVGENLLPAGVVVPGAASWPRLSAWISCRQIRRIQPDAEHTTYEDFLAGVEAEKAERAIVEAVVVDLETDSPAEVPEPKE